MKDGKEEGGKTLHKKASSWNEWSFVEWSY